MKPFSLSLPRGVKSPVKTSRFALYGIRMPFFKVYIKSSELLAAI